MDGDSTTSPGKLFQYDEKGEAEFVKSIVCGKLTFGFNKRSAAAALCALPELSSHSDRDWGTSTTPQGFSHCSRPYQPSLAHPQFN